MAAYHWFLSEQLRKRHWQAPAAAHQGFLDFRPHHHSTSCFIPEALSATQAAEPHARHPEAQMSKPQSQSRTALTPVHCGFRLPTLDQRSG